MRGGDHIVRMTRPTQVGAFIGTPLRSEGHKPLLRYFGASSNALVHVCTRCDISHITVATRRSVGIFVEHSRRVRGATRATVRRRDKSIKGDDDVSRNPKVDHEVASHS